MLSHSGEHVKIERTFLPPEITLYWEMGHGFVRSERKNRDTKLKPWSVFGQERFTDPPSHTDHQSLTVT